MDQLELHQVTSYWLVGGANIADCVVLTGNFVVLAGLRAAEAHLSNQQVNDSLTKRNCNRLKSVMHL